MLRPVQSIAAISDARTNHFFAAKARTGSTIAQSDAWIVRDAELLIGKRLAFAPGKSRFCGTNKSGEFLTIAEVATQ
jgi:hypothetical protein